MKMGMWLKEWVKNVKGEFLGRRIVDGIEMNIVFVELLGEGRGGRKGNFERVYIGLGCIGWDV